MIGEDYRDEGAKAAPLISNRKVLEVSEKEQRH